MTTTTPTFPRASAPDTMAAVLLDTSKMLALYNARPDAGDAETTLSDNIKAWISTTATANDWVEVEFISDVCILKAVATPHVLVSSTPKASTRASTGSNTPQNRR